MTIASDPLESPVPPPRRLPALYTPGVKVAGVVLLAMVLLIPIFLVDQVNRERALYQENARAEYQKSWGPSQSVLNPVLIVPYLAGSSETRRYLHIAPRRLAIETRLTPEIRRRGLFRAIVYRANVAMNGEFNLSREALPVGADARVLWEDARIMLGATDLRELQPDAALNWGGRALRLSDESKGTSDPSCANYALLWATPSLGAGEPNSEAIPFSTTLDLRGTGGLRFVPIARQTTLTASAPWKTPSFSGMALPSHYRVDDAGFTADWAVNGNAATGRWMWTSNQMTSCDNRVGVPQNIALQQNSNEIAVELVEAMPIYHMTERASKYAVLFLALAFLTYFLFETISRVRIHLVQYGLLGLSITLFGLLLISFSEPLGFTPAYAVSSLMVLAQASLFTLSVTRLRRLALTFAALLAALFCFLYVVLSLELYALLVGSVALFATLSLVMAVTRHIDWSPSRGSAVQADSSE